LGINPVNNRIEINSEVYLLILANEKPPLLAEVKKILKLLKEKPLTIDANLK